MNEVVHLMLLVQDNKDLLNHLNTLPNTWKLAETLWYQTLSWTSNVV